MLSPVRVSVCLSVRHTGGSINKKAELSQRRPRDAPNIWVTIYLPNFKFVALRVPEIIGGTQKISAVPG